MHPLRRANVALASLAVLLVGCGSDTVDSGSDDGRPTIAVTTNILGDVVGELVGDQAAVVTIMPVGADPHDFQASAQEINTLLGADALITNGGGFEEGLLDAIESAAEEGVPTFEALDAVTTTLEYGADHDEESHDGDHDDHEDEGTDDHDDHEDEETDDHDEDHGDHTDHDGVDPHFFTDPVRMSDAVEAIAAFLTTNVAGLDEAAVNAAMSDYRAELQQLDTETEALMNAIPPERRVLVTNHEVFGYFADRYGFRVIGAVAPGGSTGDSASAGELADLADLIRSEGVPAIFIDTSSTRDLANTLAAEVGDIEVIELYSESLGESGSDGATYLDMVGTNAERIATALG